MKKPRSPVQRRRGSESNAETLTSAPILLRCHLCSNPNGTCCPCARRRLDVATRDSDTPRRLIEHRVRLREFTGTRSVQAEAIEAPDLLAIIREAFESRMDMGRYRLQLERESEARLDALRQLGGVDR
jgi:hypothetical protein